MKQVTAIDAMRDLNKYLRDMYCWCDHNGSYTTGVVSVSRDTIKQLRRVTDAVLDNVRNGTPIYVKDGYNGVYEQLVSERTRSGDGSSKLQGRVPKASGDALDMAKVLE